METKYEGLFQSIVAGKSGGNTIIARLIMMRYAEQETPKDVHGDSGHP